MPNLLKFLWPWLLLLTTNGLILLDGPPGLRFGAALLLLAFLPGWAWLRTSPLPDGAERLTLAAGLSLALTVLAAMFAVYLPGPLSPTPLLSLVNLITILGFLFTNRSPAPPLPRSPAPYLLLLAILLLAAALRLPHLGYAEFHEDEAEALMLGVRLFQGEDYALFLHRKGPAQMLLPVSLWLLTGQINETLARFPFALSSLLSVAAPFFLGRRWFSWPVGTIAALLWAVNGYSLAFGRMVQYQALIFFLGPLALYCLTLAWQQRQLRWQVIAAVLLAVCLLAHFDALLLLPAAGYLWWKADRLEGWKNVSPLLLRPSAPLLFLTLLAAFYIPYLLDPEFSNTAAYLTESRVKPGLLYNNLGLLARLDGDYSSHFYLPLLAIGLGLFLLTRGRSLTRRWQVGLLGLGVLAISTIWLPDLWRLGSLDLALLPWLLLGLLLFWRLLQPEIRAALLLLGAPLIGYVFLVDDPRTHLYIAYPGAVMLAGVGWLEIRRLGDWRLGDWNKTSILPALHSSILPFFQPSMRSVPIILLTAAGLCLPAIILYEATIFLRTESGLERLRAGWPGSLWKTVYDDLPAPREYFGYPKREGWKAIGALRAEGLFPGDFRSVNEDFIIPIWYNFGEARSCYDTPAHFFFRPLAESPPPNGQGYHEVAQIEREGEVRLHIFSAAGAASGPPAVYELEPLVAAFDRLATPQQFAQQAEPAQAVGSQFGPAILFSGYNLPATSVAPGQTLYLDLYWQALAPPGDDYRAFAHLTDGRTLWAQQDDNLACRLPTSIWRAGQRGLGQFRLTVNPDTPPGRYPLVIGVYQAQTLERLQITAGAGQVGDDFLWLGDIEVRAP